MNGWLALGVAVTSMAYKASADDALRVALTGLDEPAYQLQPRHRISLVIPAYNEHKYIGNLLRSARNQTEPLAEIIVADCSDPEDDTASIARSWGARVIPVAQGNISGSRNSGAENASGDILVFADADQILSNSFVAQAVDALEAGAVLAEPRLAIYDSALWHMIMHGPQVIKMHGAPSCLAIWSQAFRDLGGYDVSCNLLANGYCHEDVEFLNRAIKTYDQRALRLLSTYIGTSARRYKKFGFGGYGDNFATPVRSYQLAVGS